MKILIVGRLQSVHIARWVNLFKNKKWKIYLFPHYDAGWSHFDLQKGIIFHTFFSYRRNQNYAYKIGIPLPSRALSDIFRFILHKIIPHFQYLYLYWVLYFIKPDIIHSIGTHASLAVLDVKLKHKGFKFPYWIHTNWGHDFYFLRNFNQYERRIRTVLQQCDLYTAECKRDITPVYEHNYKKKRSCQYIPTLAGLDLNFISQHRMQFKPSQRLLIMIKGYQHHFGRALSALRAIQDCSEKLKPYRIVIYSISNMDVNKKAQELSSQFGLQVTCLPDMLPQKTIVQLHCKAMISIGLSLSDGISASFLEAIASGSFPIQSRSACADEWIIHGKTGLLVDPENIKEIRDAIVEAISNKSLIDKAAIQNWKTVTKRLNLKKHQQLAENLYTTFYRA